MIKKGETRALVFTPLLRAKSAETTCPGFHCLGTISRVDTRNSGLFTKGLQKATFIKVIIMKKKSNKNWVFVLTRHLTLFSFLSPLATQPSTLS
jgi:hypothetical protein